MLKALEYPKSFEFPTYENCKCWTSWKCDIISTRYGNVVINGIWGAAWLHHLHCQATAAAGTTRRSSRKSFLPTSKSQNPEDPAGKRKKHWTCPMSRNTMEYRYKQYVNTSIQWKRHCNCCCAAGSSAFLQSPSASTPSASQSSPAHCEWWTPKAYTGLQNHDLRAVWSWEVQFGTLIWCLPRHEVFEMTSNEPNSSITHAQSPNSLPCWEDADGRPRWARHWHWQGSRAWRWCYSRSPGQPCNQPSDLPLDLGALKLQKSERRKLQMSLLQAVFPTLSSLLLCFFPKHPVLSWASCSNPLVTGLR